MSSLIAAAWTDATIDYKLPMRLRQARKLPTSHWHDPANSCDRALPSQVRPFPACLLVGRFGALAFVRARGLRLVRLCLDLVTGRIQFILGRVACPIPPGLGHLTDGAQLLLPLLHIAPHLLSVRVSVGC